MSRGVFMLSVVALLAACEEGPAPLQPPAPDGGSREDGAPDPEGITVCDVAEKVFEPSCAGGSCHNAAQSPRLVAATRTASAPWR